MRWKIWPSGKERKRELRKQGIGLLERTLKSTPAVIIGIVLTFVLGRAGLLQQLETHALDTQVRLQGVADDSDVAIVHIDDEDYARLFHQKSPLDHTTLSKILNAIAAGQARVIGVDIDTSAAEFRDLQPAPGWPPVVWARNGAVSNRDGKYRLFQFLGGRQTDQLFGLVVMRLDPDDAIRRYPRLCETDQGPVNSFPWAVAKAFDPAKAASQNPTNHDLFIRFAGDSEAPHRLHFSASRILELAEGAGWQTDSPIKGKIVLLGGAYAAADEHDTPLGWMLGVEVLGYAIETELHGGGLRPPSPLLVTAVGGVAGLALLLLFQHRSPIKAFLISLFCIPILGMLGSLIIFRSLALWAYFVPIPLAVLTQETYYQAKDYRKKLIKKLYEGVMGTPVKPQGARTEPQEDFKAVDEQPSAPAESAAKPEETEPPKIVQIPEAESELVAGKTVPSKGRSDLMSSADRVHVQRLVDSGQRPETDRVDTK